MTDERLLDRRVLDWLELGPDHAPDRVITTILSAVKVTPQVRARSGHGWTWRFTSSKRAVLLASIAIATVLVATSSTLPVV